MSFLTIRVHVQGTGFEADNQSGGQAGVGEGGRQLRRPANR